MNDQAVAHSIHLLLFRKDEITITYKWIVKSLHIRFTFFHFGRIKLQLLINE